jgi:hypothetical protein
MDTDLTGLYWFKSSASSAAGCVEIAHLPEGRAGGAHPLQPRPSSAQQVKG